MTLDGENRDGGSASVRVLKHCLEDVDSISSLPDVILQENLSLIPTKFAIRTSVLSKRWRHVWSETPSLDFDDCYKLDVDFIDKTLALYRARKIMTFDLWISNGINLPYIDGWIKFAMSRNVENLFLSFDFRLYDVPDYLYINSSVKQLSIAKILSGCPIIESLTLHFCDQLRVLDLTKSPSLKILEIHGSIWAKVDICFCSLKEIKANFLLDTVLKCLYKLQNVDKLTFGANFLKGRGAPFPMFKAKALTLETTISKYVIPVQGEYDPTYLRCMKLDHCSIFAKISRWNVESKHVASFMELMIKTTKKLEKMVVRLESYLDERGFEELLEMVPMLSRNNNVSIVLSSTKPRQSL
ncbi:unnamed protein product [Arabidopsis thaliana]|uniref:F-box domain-containing protein n=1 Tax=Arabidopsis thaliana TaxID=3702 RepID=A0A654EIJ0_ARATH|nr:unnamed protein product [Arabidopsis thaliana]